MWWEGECRRLFLSCPHLADSRVLWHHVKFRLEGKKGEKEEGFYRSTWPTHCKVPRMKACHVIFAIEKFPPKSRLLATVTKINYLIPQLDIFILFIYFAESKEDVKRFLKAIREDFLSTVNSKESGLEDILVQNGVLNCDSDVESLRHYPTRKDESRCLYFSRPLTFFPFPCCLPRIQSSVHPIEQTMRNILDLISSTVLCVLLTRSPSTFHSVWYSCFHDEFIQNLSNKMSVGQHDMLKCEWVCT